MLLLHVSLCNWIVDTLTHAPTYSMYVHTNILYVRMYIQYVCTYIRTVRTGWYNYVCTYVYVSWRGGESWVDQRVPRAYIRDVALLL